MNNEPVAWIDKNTGKPRMEGFIKTDHDIPLYTQDQLEEARKLGMQQERAMWELAASTQDIMNTHPVKEEAEQQSYQEQDGCPTELAVLQRFWRNNQPVKELNNGGEPVKNATYWKRQYNLMATQNDNLKSGLYHANEQIKYLESHPVKELTLNPEKIIELQAEYGIDSDLTCHSVKDFVLAILKKAQE